MTEPEKEYFLITKEELSDISNNELSLKQIDIIRSRPYTSAEKVLEELDESLQEAIKDIESVNNISERERGEIIGLLDARQRVKELREGER